jgi:phenylalanyl-tRNA synthetase beta chain
MFSEYCENKFEVEPVEVVYHDGSKTVYPDLSCYKMEVSLSDLIGPIGITKDVMDEKQVSFARFSMSPKIK